MSDYRAAAAEALIRHSSYVWNKSRTRIKCKGDDCATVLDAPDGDASAIAVFAGHQAEQLPLPPVPAPVEQENVQLPAPEAEHVNIETEPDTEGQEPEPEPDAPETPEPAGEPVEQVLSEAALAVADQVTAPKIRRDTKALTATIEEIKKGDRVSATFNHPRYGYFTVEGTVIKGGTGLDRNQLMVGGWYINLNERAAKYLCGLEILAAAGKHEFVIPKPSELTEHVGIGS